MPNTFKQQQYTLNVLKDIPAEFIRCQLDKLYLHKLTGKSRVDLYYSLANAFPYYSDYQICDLETEIINIYKTEVVERALEKRKEIKAQKEGTLQDKLLKAEEIRRKELAASEKNEMKSSTPLESSRKVSFETPSQIETKQKSASPEGDVSLIEVPEAAKNDHDSSDKPTTNPDTDTRESLDLTGAIHHPYAPSE
jgi:hypothetical protein